MVRLGMRRVEKINDVIFFGSIFAFGSLKCSSGVSYLSRPNSYRCQYHRGGMVINKSCNGFSDERGGK